MTPNREQNMTALRQAGRRWLAPLFLITCWLPGQTLFAQGPGNSMEGPVSGYGQLAWPEAVRMADFILLLQNAGGAIPDEKGVITVNQDSNMEYALIGLGAAYAATKDRKYLDGLERGIKWLAEREEMSDPRWTGSWYYVYSANPPYAKIPTSPGTGITDARGVDATSTLFAYLLYLDERLTANNSLAQRYAPNARAALDFVINHNLDSDGFSRSSWHLYASDGHWHLYTEKYSADQGDVYLGMHAGELLFHDAKYARVAELLRAKTPAQFFSSSEQRYGLGIHQDGKLDTSDDGNSAAFSQGYLSWMWGDNAQNRAALKWLQSKIQSDGSIVSVPGKPAYSLNVAMLALADKSLGQPAPAKSLRWLMDTAYDRETSGVRRSPDPADKHEFNNETGFILLAYLGFLPFD
jgi:hypothetical protein